MEEKGIDKESGYENLTPLISAVINGDSEIVKLLLKSGVNINTNDEYGYTVLEIASLEGCVRIVEMLLKEGESALSLAAENDHVEVVKVLLSAGAPIVEEDKEIYEQFKERHPEVYKSLESKYIESAFCVIS